jgi:hypothetical protein
LCSKLPLVIHREDSSRRRYHCTYGNSSVFQSGLPAVK